jgi:simple sugar transport system permease protein
MRAESDSMLARLAHRPFARALLVLGAVLALSALLTPGFLSLEVRDGRLFGPLVDVLHRASPTVLVALGMTLVIGTGGVDLSAGSVMAIAATLAALALRARDLPSAVLIPSVMLCGALLGALNGLLVAKLRIQPIVATLILYTSGRGLAQLLSAGAIVTFEDAGFERLAAGSLLGLPITIWIVLASFALLALAMRFTAFGLYVVALGDNPRSARLAGLPTTALIVGVYAICAALAALAGQIVAADIKAADAASCGAYVELDAILAVVLGGTALTGGRVQLAGTIVGALILQTLTTTVLMHGARFDVALIVKAVAVVGVCALHSPRISVFRRRVAEASS